MDLYRGMLEAYPELERLGTDFWQAVKDDKAEIASYELTKIARFVSRRGGADKVRENVIHQAKQWFEHQQEKERAYQSACRG